MNFNLRERSNAYVGDEGEYVKVVFHPKLMSFESEWNAYFKKFGRVYRIEKSNSGLRWVLTYDSKEFHRNYSGYGWDQKGLYLRTLKGNTWQEALADVIKKMPNEEAFFFQNGAGYISNDVKFDDWFDEITS